MLEKAKHTVRQFPLPFWGLVLTGFIDTIGSTLVFPFFSLYVTRRFGIGMTRAGILVGSFFVTGLVGSMVGGALTDRLGRRALVLFGLVFSALSALSLGLANSLALLHLVALVVGLFAELGAPARQAMVADLLPPEQRAEGFGILRVAANLAWIVGPTIGGALASRSFLLLFVLDAIISLINAALAYRLLPESRPQAKAIEQRESLLQTLAGYRLVARDGLYVAFLLVSMVMLIVYQQLYTTLSVFLRDARGFSAQGYGFLLSLNAATVVLLQFWITRRAKRFPPMLVMATAASLYMVGFSLFGLVYSLAFFAIAMILITVGEMIAVPTGQALASRLAPAEYRGRYMAFYGLAWSIPSAVGPLAAGLIFDSFDPNLLWYICGMMSAAAVVGFCTLHWRSRDRFAPLTIEKQPVSSPG